MKTFTDQLQDHLNFLRSHGLDVLKLVFGQVKRCHSIGETQGRGEFAYCCSLNPMKKGYVGIVTWCRAPSGAKHTFKTYGLGQESGEVELSPSVTFHDDSKKAELQEQAARKAYGFWKSSSLSGLSCYLARKGVGSYGIRFRSSEKYGNVAVVPMLDDKGRLWCYQLLNPDGKKRMTKDARTKGLFHILQSFTNGQTVGIAESYVTAATCLELTGIPTVSAFSSDNLPETAKIIRKLYPESSVTIFADNDRHLVHRGNQNLGILKAQEAIDALGWRCFMAEPDFGDCEPSKELSDWNDLVRIKGFVFAKQQIKEKLGLI